MNDNDDVDSIQRGWEQERPDLEVDSIAIITRIWRIARRLEQHRQRLLAELDTDASTLDLLATLRRSGSPYQLTPNEIAARTLLTSGGVSQRLAKAEDAGLITREVSPADRRSVVVSMTPAGLSLIDHIVTELFASEQQVVDRLASTDRKQLADLLRTFLATLDPRHEHTESA